MPNVDDELQTLDLDTQQYWHQLDAELQALILEAQQHPPQSRARQKLLDRIIQLISLSPRCYLYDKCPPSLEGCYDYLRKIALQPLYCYLWKNLDKYDPQKGKVRTWLNGVYPHKFTDAVRKVSPIHPEIPYFQVIPLSKLIIIGWDMVEKSDNSDDLEQLLQRIEKQGICLKDRCYRYNRKVNMELFLCKRLEYYSWEEIAEEAGFEVIDETTLKNLKRWYKGEIKKLSSLLESKTSREKKHEPF